MKNFDNKVQFSIPKTPLPHNFVAEKIVLSCLLINYEAIEITMKTVQAETFYFINHQEIYKAIIEMYRKKVPINVFSVNDFLKRLEVKFAVIIALLLLKKNMTFLLKYNEAKVFVTINKAAEAPSIPTCN